MLTCKKKADNGTLVLKYLSQSICTTQGKITLQQREANNFLIKG